MLAGLEERTFHALVGLTREQIANRYGTGTLFALEHRSEGLELAGEETLAQAAERVHATVAHILTHPHQRLAIVSHGGPHGWLLASALGLDVRESRLFRLDEASFSIFAFQPEEKGFRLTRIVTLNARMLPAGLLAQNK